MVQLHRLPVRTPVENAHLRPKKTEKRNGETVCSLSLEVDTVSRCQPQATRRKDCPKSQGFWEYSGPRCQDDLLLGVNSTNHYVLAVDIQGNKSEAITIWICNDKSRVVPSLSSGTNPSAATKQEPTGKAEYSERGPLSLREHGGETYSLPRRARRST